MRAVTALLAGLLLCLSSPALADVSVGNGSVGIPVAPVQGGLGPAAGVAVQKPAGNLITFGDSFVSSGGGSTSCSGTFNVLNTTPTGTCFSDLLAIYYGVPVLNLGQSGTCVTTYQAGDYCTTQGNSGTSRYVSQLLPNCTPNNLVIIQYGGVNEIYHADVGFTPALFQAGLDTIIAACQAAGATQIVLMDAPYDTSGVSYPASQANLFLLDAAVSNEGIKRNLPVTDAYGTLTPCWQNVYPTPTTYCSTDGLHPNLLGNQMVAAAVENATYTTSVMSQFFTDHAASIMQPVSFGTGYVGNSLTLPYKGSNQSMYVGPGANGGSGGGGSSYGQIQLANQTTTSYWTGTNISSSGVSGTCGDFGQVGGSTFLSFDCTNVGIKGYAAAKSGVLDPQYVAAGTTSATTFHCNNTPAAGLTAAGVTTTVTYSGNAVFAGIHTPEIEDVTALAAVVPTAQSTTGFTFTSIVGHVYSFHDCGE